MLVQKKAKKVRAWCLGAGTEMEAEMLRQGRITRLSDGTYRVRSQENDTDGQLVPAGDYFKVDSAGAPYPNSRDFFLANHTLLEGDVYLQTSPVRKAWHAGEPLCPEITFLMDSGKLQVNEEDPQQHFTAFLWGAWLHAASDAVIIFDEVILRGGHISEVSFHFITREEFDLTYRITEP